MKLSQRYIGIGKLPYDNIKLTTGMLAKLYSKMPFIPILPNMDANDSIEYRTFNNIPGVVFRDNKLILKTGSERYQREISKLDKLFGNPVQEDLENYEFDAVFMEKFCQMLTKFKPGNACISFWGPFTISQKLIDVAKEQTVTDKKYRKLFVEAVCVKGLWAIKKIKQISPKTTPIILLEEPMLSQLGMVKREDEEVTPELIIGLLQKVVDKLKSAGAIVGVQCMEKCDWSVPIKAGVDLISYDAYNNPNNLCIIPEILTDFLNGGGMINWAIVPVHNEAIIKGLTIDYLVKRFNSTMSGVALSGVPANLLRKASTVSVNGDVDNVPLIFAEKAHILASQLGAKLN